MTDQQIIKHIDDSALYYIKLFSMAKHMEFIDNGYYSIIKPMNNKKGISFIFDIRLNNLSTDIQKEKINEIKSFNYPIWLGLQASNNLYYMLYKKKFKNQHVELYMALLPNEKKEINMEKYMIVLVNSIKLFTVWVKLANNIFFNNDSIINPINYYHLCKEKLIKCYILYYNNEPVAISSIINNNGIASLEFVGTIKEMRNKGFASNICNKAIEDAFKDGSKIVTLRSSNENSSKIYKKLGFKAYNHLL